MVTILHFDAYAPPDAATMSLSAERRAERIIVSNPIGRHASLSLKEKRIVIDEESDCSYDFRTAVYANRT